MTKWKVRCCAAGTVSLAMWRPMGSVTSIQLIGKHKITVTNDAIDQIVVSYSMRRGSVFSYKLWSIVI